MSGSHSLKKAILAFFILIFSTIPAFGSWDNLSNDIEVVYLFEQSSLIDWPLIYHLAGEEGCRVKLVRASEGGTFRATTKNTLDNGIQLYELAVPAVTWSYLDSMYNTVATWRQPDIVISAQDFTTETMRAFERYWLSLPYDQNKVFQTRKFYRRDFTGKEGSVHINNSFYIGRFPEPITEIAKDLLDESPTLDNENIYSTYKLVKTYMPAQSGKASFAAGFDRFRLDNLAEQLMIPGMALNSIRDRSEDYLTSLENSEICDGTESLEAVFDAVEALQNIRRDYLASPNGHEDAPLVKYIDTHIEELSDILIDRTGITFSGQPLLRDTPQGTRLKLLTELRNNGPLTVKVGDLELHPYWTDEVTVIEPGNFEILPFKKFTREYTIDIETSRIETLAPESLLVTGQIDYHGRKLDFGFYAGTKVISPMKIQFLPDFVIIDPFPELQVDRLVTQVELSALITKPVSDAVKIRIKIDTPGGIMAGAFADKVTIPAGVRSYEFAIPMVATKSLPIGSDRIIIRVFEGDKLMAADTCLAAVAEHNISGKVKIALVPDKDGILEDILLMTHANYKTISDRFLEAQDLNYYDVIAIGSGADKYYPSLNKVDGKLKRYMESGGTVLVFGQADTWGSDYLPVSLSPYGQSLSSTDININRGNHKIFNKTYHINLQNLARAVNPGLVSFPASVFPADDIITSKRNGVLLSESDFQKGRLIYCGLPLPEMVRELDRDAIKFFTNMINYSGE